MNSNLSLVTNSKVSGLPAAPYHHKKWMAEAFSLDPDDVMAFLRDFSAQSPSIVEEAQVLKRLKESTHLPLPVLRKQLIAFKGNVAEADDIDQLDLGREILAFFGADNFVHVGSVTYRWNVEGIWRVAHDREIKNEVQTYAKERGLDVTASLVNSVLDLMKSEVFVPESPFEKQDVIKINCLNGTLVWDAAAWDLKAFERDDYFTSQIPVHYDKKATCEVFMKFLSSCFDGDEDANDKAHAVLQMLGYTLLRTCKFEKGILLLGQGANGKSVLLSLVEKLLGVNNVSGVQPANFDNRFQLGSLRGKLANIVTELPAHGAVPDGPLKQIMSGELMTAEHKNRPPFEFRPYCTLWVGTNKLPNTNDASDALYRRCLVLRFNNQFLDDDPRRDPDLSIKLGKELPGILNLALNALTDLLLRGSFVLPASSIKEVRTWRHDQDPVKHFLDTYYVAQSGADVEITHLHDHFRRVMEEEGHISFMSKNLLSRRLGDLGFQRTKGTNGKRLVLGLQLREETPL